MLQIILWDYKELAIYSYFISSFHVRFTSTNSDYTLL